jgi:hypothetical protein
MATSTQFWTADYGPGDTNGTYEFLNGRGPNRYHLMRILRKKGMREVGEILSTLLTDSSPSTTASVTISQLTAEADTTANVQGGVRTVAAKEIMGLTINSDKDDASAETSRAVSAADVTALQTELIPSGSRANRAPATYATDASGNGGGGKMGSGR